MPEIIAQKSVEAVVPPPAQVVILRHATVRGPGVITLPEGRLVRESLINCDTMPSICDLRRIDAGRYEAEPAFAEGQSMPDGTYVLLKQMWDGNYGHWLVEGLPRVGLLTDIFDLSACRFLVSAAESAMQAVYTASLGVFGITPGQIIVSGWEPQYFRELIYPLPLTEQPWVKAPLLVRILEDVARRVLACHPDHASAGARLFVCRTPGSRRTLRNQDKIRDLLEKRGYATVCPATMSFDEQVIAFSTARIVVGILGAECTNLVFAPAGLRFLGLAPQHMQDDFFWDLVSHKLGRYFCLHGASEDPEAAMNTPFSVDIAAFTALLEQVEQG